MSKSLLGKKILLLCLSTICSLLVAEGLLQVYYRLQNGRWLTQCSSTDIEEMEYTGPPPQLTVRPHMAPEELYRSCGQPLPEDDPAVPVILALGDSVPYGWGGPPEQSYPAQLQQLLTQAGYRVRVVNAGALGYTLGQAVDKFRYGLLERFPHPLAVTIQAANDISMVECLRESYQPGVSLEDAAINYQFYQVTRVSKIAIIHYCHRAGIRFRELRRQGERRRHGLPTPTAMMRQHVHAVLEDLLPLCHQHGIPVVLLPVDPYYYQTQHLEKNTALVSGQSSAMRSYYTRWAPIAAEYNAELAQQAAAHSGAYFYDTRAMLDAHGREGLYHDHIHYSSSGNALVAQGLLAFLRDQKLLPAR